MSNWGFRSERDALTSKLSTQQRQPELSSGDRADADSQPVFNVNYIARTPASGIDPISGDTPGRATCTVQYIQAEGNDLIDFEKWDGTGVYEVEVHNLSSEKIEGNERITIWQVGGKFVIGNAGANIFPWNMVRVQITADLFAKNQPAINWQTAEERSAAPYDEPVVAEPTGIINPFGIDCPDGGWIWIGRYDHVVGENTLDQWYVFDRENWYARFIEADVISGGPGAWVLSIVSWADGEDPGNFTWDDGGQLPTYQYPSINAPNFDRISMRYNPNVNQYFWINKVKYQARWIYGEWTISGPSQNCQPVPFTIQPFCGGPGYWEGEDPGPTVTAVFEGTPFDCGTSTTFTGKARYRRETDEYVIITTESANMGAPTAGTVEYGPMEWRCDTDNDSWCLDRRTKPAAQWVCEPEFPSLVEPTELGCIDSKEFLDCLDICTYICLYCDSYSGPEDCGEDDCCVDCRFPEVEPITTLSGSTTTGGAFSASMVSSSRINECTFAVTMDNDTTWTVSYLGGGDWSLDYELGGSGGTATGAGDCTFATDFTSGDPLFEALLTAAGTVCTEPDPDCCPGSWDGTTSIQDFRSGPAPEVGFFQKVGEPVQRISGCAFRVIVEVRDLVNGLPELITTGTADLFFDDPAPPPVAGKWHGL